MPRRNWITEMLKRCEISKETPRFAKSRVIIVIGVVGHSEQQESIQNCNVPQEATHGLFVVAFRVKA